MVGKSRGKGEEHKRSVHAISEGAGVTPLKEVQAIFQEKAITYTRCTAHADPEDIPQTEDEEDTKTETREVKKDGQQWRR